nr:peptidylprolyl isomerase A [Escherichia coli]
MFKSTLAAMAAVFALSALSPAAMAAKGDPHVLLTTSAGNIELELDKQKAPVSVQNFVDYVNSGFYNNTTFHRVIPGFMIQGGGFTEQMQQKKPNPPIKNEADNGLRNTRGTIAMARTADKDSATSQFFINVADNAFLDHGQRDFGYAVFGKVGRKASEVWKMERATRQAADLLRYGGEVQCNFRLVNTLTANQFAFGCYLLVNESDVPAGASLRLKAEGTTPALMNFFIQTNATDLNLMMHCKPDNIRLGTYGAYNQDWHSFRVVYHGGNTARATLYLDGESKGEFTLAYSPGAVDAGMLQLTNITSSPTYGCNIKDFTVKIYRDDAIVSLPDDDVSSLVYFPEGSRGGKVVLPDAKISAGNTVQVVVNNAGIIAIEPASSNVLLNNLPSSATTDRSVTLVQTSLDGKTWVIT